MISSDKLPLSEVINNGSFTTSIKCYLKIKSLKNLIIELSICPCVFLFSNCVPFKKIGYLYYLFPFSCATIGRYYISASFMRACTAVDTCLFYIAVFLYRFILFLYSASGGAAGEFCFSLYVCMSVCMSVHNFFKKYFLRCSVFAFYECRYMISFEAT